MRLLFYQTRFDLSGHVLIAAARSLIGCSCNEARGGGRIDTCHRIERDWKRQGQPFAHIERLVQLRKCYQYELRNRRLCGPRP